MKILLTTLNARYIHSNLALKYLYSVAALVRDAIEIREFTINQEDDLIYTELMLEDSDVLCFSCYIWNIERILYLADTVKKARPETIVILGGPEVSHRAEQILKDHPAVDMILAGEAEETFPKLLRVLFEQAGENEKYATEENGNIITDFEKALGFYGIDGLAFRNEGAVVVNSVAAAVDFLKAPFPYQQLPCETDKIVYYESSRGCPFQCTYCLSSLERGVRALPIERVKQDIRYFLYKGVKQVKFLDRTFNYDKERAAEIFRYLIEIDNKTINFHFEMCGELFDENLLALAEKARP
ncbi:MAG: cobalamin-dependent protein, partial [Eubacteriales bacterium]|nr:cobalamin-dependent protein [Eubacteriales bacterium]